MFLSLFVGGALLLLLLPLHAIYTTSVDVNKRSATLFPCPHPLPLLLGSSPSLLLLLLLNHKLYYVNIPLDDGARIRIRLAVQRGQDHGQDDARQEEETAPSDARPESVLRKDTAVNQELVETRLINQMKRLTKGQKVCWQTTAVVAL